MFDPERRHWGESRLWMSSKRGQVNDGHVNAGVGGGMWLNSPGLEVQRDDLRLEAA